MNCPNCNEKVIFEDHSSIGGSKYYWDCPNCEYEQIIFMKTKLRG